jgi:hypothetical protein
MPPTLTPTIILVLLALLTLAFLFVHWRFHTKQTSLESFNALQERLKKGKPVLVQFSAPL